MSRGWHLAGIVLFAAVVARAQSVPGPAAMGDEFAVDSISPVRTFVEAESHVPLRFYSPESLLVMPRPRPAAVLYQHRWERIHPFHIAGLCNLRKRFLRAIHGHRDWFSQTKVFPFASLNGGRFYLGIETREALLVEPDSRYAVLARQIPGPPVFPFHDSDRRIAVSFRWNLD